MTGAEVARGKLAQLGRGLAAYGPCVFAPSAELAARRGIYWAGHIALEHYAAAFLFVIRVSYGYCRKQRRCVGVLRVFLQLLAFRKLHYAAQVHHTYPVGYVLYHGKR